LQVLADGEIRVQAVHLGHHADLAARQPGLCRHGVAEQFHRAGVGADQAQGQAQGGGLAGAVGAQQAMAAARFQFQVEAVHNELATVAFG
jgi:hypothetical protein